MSNPEIAAHRGSYAFDVIKLSAEGKEASRVVERANFHKENLDDEIEIDMVEIPGGSFLMGTSYAELEQISGEYKRYVYDPVQSRYADELIAMEVPQHKVNIEAFRLSKFEITQRQWRAVALLPSVDIDLPIDPSFFKGEDRPVEEITWQQAIEFCARLSRKTGIEYSLPSEAEWEYACRAGTTTQFNVGDNITPNLANFNARYPYGAAPPSVSRDRTISVGSLGTANGFGLFDMHGNVSEWCLDTWHENYNGAPNDGRAWKNHGGSPWLGCGEQYRVVRGGSWLQGPMRSAGRSRAWWTNNKNYFTGFRIASPRSR